MTTIIISGTPGTGKTTLAKKLEKQLKYSLVDVEAITKRIAEGYDKSRSCIIIDTRKLNSEIIKIIKKKGDYIIDSHLSHHLQKKYVNLCIITKCDLKKLKKRLIKKGYGKRKVRENLDTEIFDICYFEAMEAGHNLVVVETDKDSWRTIRKKIKSGLASN